MDRLYDEDIFAWSEQQAAALRQLARTPGRLPNDLDLEQVAEEIEDLGRSERHAAESSLRLILVHLLEIAIVPDAPVARHWRSEIVTFHIEFLSRLTPAMAGRIDLRRIWTQAKRQARAGLEEAGASEGAIWDVPHCPLSLESFTKDDIDVDLAIARLRAEPRP